MDAAANGNGLDAADREAQLPRMHRTRPARPLSVSRYLFASICPTLRSILQVCRRLLPASLACGVALTSACQLGAAPQLLPGVHGYGADRAINAAGFGADATIIEVTNLNNSGAGSLRAALQTPGRRIVVFRTSGVIELQSAINVSSGNVTIAGQTAPSPGIAIHGAGLDFTASNVLVQHLRIRPGDAWSGVSTTNRDCVSFAHPSVVIANAVFDHCTFSWSLDEMASTWYSWDNVTFNKCLFAEPLHVSIHLDEGTFSPNVPQPAENLSNTKSVEFPTTTTASTHAVAGSFQLVGTTADEQWIEYTLNLVRSNSSRGEKHLTVVGVKGPDRARFRAELRDPANNVLLNSGEIADQYSATEAQHTYISHQNLSQSFTIPANVTSLKVRLIVAGRNAASTGWQLGIDQILITDAHGFGPLFSSGVNGGGKLSFTGSILAHFAGRGPWGNSKQFYFANNVVYNRFWQALHLGHSSWPNDRMNAAILGNTFIEGKDISGSQSLPSPISNTAVPSGSQLHVGAADDNAYNFGDRRTPPPMVANNLRNFLVASDPTLKTAGLAGVTPMSPAYAFSDTLADAGARPADRDAFELRIVDEISRGAATAALANRPGSLKHSVASAGGWPTLPVNTVTHTYPANPNADDDGDGYTNIEEWLHAKAAAVERTTRSGGGGGEILKSTGDARLLNTSTRVMVGGVAGTPAPGFVLAGAGEKTVILRAIGPALAGFGVTGTLADPRLSLLSGTAVVASNDDWQAAHASTMAAAGAFQLPPASKDAALVTTLGSGPYTAPISMTGTTAGVALIEFYDAVAGAPGAAPLIVNASTRAYVGTGDGILIPGFVVGGDGTLRLLIRAVGPTLQTFGVDDALANPRLALLSGNTTVAANDDWATGNSVTELQAVAAHVGAFPLPPGSRDAALVVGLLPGAYTVTVNGANDAVGTALFELYVVR